MDIFICFCSKFWLCAHIRLSPFCGDLVILLEAKLLIILRGQGEVFYLFCFLWSCISTLGSFFV